ncbi:ankyrin-1-like isoform X2 [Macrosteles quadrilineatus]|nr:ankyrin-1-like isoform X2 [Macrosteles quadrilineatus]
MTPLQAAVSLGHYDICQHLVEEDAILISTSTIPDPLCLALIKGDYEIANYLIESGVGDIELPFKNELPLGFALDNEDCPMDIVKDFIDAGFPVDDRVYLDTGRSALHAAVNNNHINIVRYLLSLEIDTNVVDNRGFTPLHYAVQNNYPLIVKLLIRNGAKVDCECEEKFTPMFYAISAGDFEMVKLLLGFGANIHHISGNERCPMTPLHYAANFCKLKITQLLLERKANVNSVVPVTGEIPLHSASRAEIVNSPQNPQNKVALDCIVELLINEGANLEAKQKFGLTPLQLALKYKNISVAKILITSGSDINSRVYIDNDYYGTTFHVVAETFDKDLIKLCLEHGADYMAKDNEGANPCHRALTYLMLNNSEVDPLLARHQPGEQTDVALMKLFWKYSYPFDLTLEIEWLKPGMPGFPNKVASAVQKQKMLLNGIKAQNHKMVLKAFSQGAEAQFFSKEQRNPVHFIASKGNEAILKEFLTRGVPVNSLNRNGETPLHQAAKAGHVNCCRLLLEYGAVYNYISTKSNRTPCQMAAQNNHGEVEGLLLTIDKHFKDMKKGYLKVRQDMKIFPLLTNCVHRDGKTLLGRALDGDFIEAAFKIMRMRFQNVKLE